MKAYYEMELPTSCVKCEFCQKVIIYFICDRLCINVSEHLKDRHKDCPLIIKNESLDEYAEKLVGEVLDAIEE